MAPKIKDNFKVVIVGGGVAGLTLAIMLERFDIDYVVLESRSEIAPNAGASIGLFPNGLRILDQIDCYEDILKLPITPININRMRNLSKGAVSEALFLRCHDHFVQR
jgi:2-polyprenyl-6-methoxyphenol hydroxylase-like FAD-dependent oxidoreductase